MNRAACWKTAGSCRSQPGDLGQCKGGVEAVAQLVAEVAGGVVQQGGFVGRARIVVHQRGPQRLPCPVDRDQRAGSAIDRHRPESLLDTWVLFGKLFDYARRRLTDGPPPRLGRLLVPALLRSEDFRVESRGGCGSDPPSFADGHCPHAAGAHVDAQEKLIAGFHAVSVSCFRGQLNRPGRPRNQGSYAPDSPHSSARRRR